MRLTAKTVRMLSLAVALVLALPIHLGLFAGLYLWTSPFIMMNAVLAGGGLVLLHVLAIVVLMAAFYRPRWYCHWLCPAGVVCDTASGLSRSRIRLNRIPGLNKPLVIAALVLALSGVPLLSVLDPIAVFHMFFDGFRGQPVFLAAAKWIGLLSLIALSLAVPHVWCAKLCPLGGMQDMLTSVRNVWRKTSPPIVCPAGRRLAMGMLFGFGLKWMLAQIPRPAKRPIRPPGALPEDRFKDVCFRCGNCAKACPTNIIHSSFDADDLAGILTPQISFANGYCLPDCTSCGDGCPSNAIRKFSLADKKQLFMATAALQREKCLLSRNKECDVCRRYCSYNAIEIHNSAGRLQAWPEILAHRCVGCAACALVCPASAIAISPI